MKICCLLLPLLLCTQIAFADRQVTCPPSQISPTNDQMSVVSPMLASSDHRLWHDRWHSWRGSWHTIAQKDRTRLSGQYPQLAPPRGLGPPVDLKDKSKCTSDDYNPLKNGGGEDFFYMHHNMIKMVNERLGSNCIGGWNELPDRRTYLRGQTIADPSMESEFGLMQEWKNKFNDDREGGYLTGKSLSEVGFAVEFTLHNYMHMYYATTRPGMPNPNNRPEVPFFGRGLPPGSIYDSVAYDFLGDPYSAQVNRDFWKLHGVVDQVIFAWLKANKYEEISESCSGRPKCYEWKGKFEGERPSPSRAAGVHDQHAGHAGKNAEPAPRELRESPRNPFKDGVEEVREIRRGANDGKARGPGENLNDPIVIAKKRYANAVKACLSGSRPTRRTTGQP